MHAMRKWSVMAREIRQSAEAGPGQDENSGTSAARTACRSSFRRAKGRSAGLVGLRCQGSLCDCLIEIPEVAHNRQSSDVKGEGQGEGKPGNHRGPVGVARGDEILQDHQDRDDQSAEDPSTRFVEPARDNLLALLHPLHQRLPPDNSAGQGG